MKRLLFMSVLLVLAACGSRGSLGKNEIALIMGQDSLMHVYTVSDSSEAAVLRAGSVPFSDKDLRSAEFEALVSKMKYTVQDPSQNGVGIAAPQVGLNRRVVVVCRLDKPGEPFEAYANVAIDTLYGETVVGREGCLSVPGLRGNVARKEVAVVRYTSPETLQEMTDTVRGYTARIFQHEIDHLSGTLYTDRTDDIWED